MIGEEVAGSSSEKFMYVALASVIGEEVSGLAARSYGTLYMWRSIVSIVGVTLTGHCMIVR